MDYWCFTSPSNWFSLSLPGNWAEYEEEEDGTYSFFNKEKWSGNLRISQLHWNSEEDEIDQASKYVQSELTDNSNAILTKIGDWDAVFYSEKSQDESLIYYWVTGSKNNLFACSFTTDKLSLIKEIHSEELEIVEKILNSIKILK
ncbi:MAG TPA: DUF3805 domain-containing protein [Mucilaginibacter sp.]|jgi:hypothetical protein